MNTRALILPAIILVALTFNACSKADTVDANSKQHNEDVNDTKSESDNVNTEVFATMQGISAFGKNGEVNAAIVICGATINSSHASDPTPYITINFDGTTICPNPSRKRSGSIKVELVSGTHWTDAGAKLKITHTNYKVTFTSLNNHFVTFNGIKYLTNVNGINWVSVALLGDTVTIRERTENLSVTFDNAQVATWNVARLSKWGAKNLLTEFYTVVNGDTTINGKVIDSWGTTRFNTSFETEMIQPWVSGTACGWWRPVSGKYTSTTTNFAVTATFGTNSGGVPQSSGCPGYFKLDWLLRGNLTGSGTVVLGYW